MNGWRKIIQKSEKLVPWPGTVPLKYKSGVLMLCQPVLYQYEIKEKKNKQKITKILLLGLFWLFCSSITTLTYFLFFFPIPAASYSHNSFKANLPGEISPKGPLKSIQQYCVRCLEQWEVVDATSREPRDTR